MAELDANVNESTETTVTETEATEAESKAAEAAGNNAELAKLKAEMAKLKAANDKLSKENGEKTKALRAKQSAEEAAAEEAKAQQDALMQELETLRKERAVAATTAKVFPLVGDNETAGKIAEYLYGAEDVESALADIQKAWTAREKALRLELGKIQAPGVGNADGPSVTQAQFNAMKYMERVKFQKEHPDEYEKLMGR